jgi:Kef-type K+ transport system membrane component KefB
MPDVSFSGLLVVLLVAFLTPLLLAVFPSLRLSEPVVLIVAGIVLGPSALEVVSSDIIVNVLALIGLAFLLFLAGAEIDLSQLMGARGRAIAGGFLLSAVLAFGVGQVLDTIGLVRAPALIAITLLSTALGVLVPVLKSSGIIDSEAGQLIIAGASAADFGTVILLSLLFSQESIGTGARVALLVVFLAAALVGGFAMMRFERSRRIDKIFTALQDTTAQIRVRFAMVLLIALVALAEELGLEVILGAFVAGALMRALDREHLMTPTLPIEARSNWIRIVHSDLLCVERNEPGRSVPDRKRLRSGTRADLRRVSAPRERTTCHRLSALDPRPRVSGRGVPPVDFPSIHPCCDPDRCGPWSA